MLIVIVDDEPIMCRSITAVLNATGQAYTVEQFSGKHCGGAVLKWLEFNNPDYCILDVLLNGVSGLDVADKVQMLYPDTKILLMTGCANDSEYYKKSFDYAEQHKNVNCLLKRESSVETTFIGSLLNDLNTAVSM